MRQPALLSVALACVIAATPRSAAADPPLSDELAALNERVLLAPSDVEVRLRRADTLLRAGAAADALNDVRVAEVLAPEDGRTVLLRASCLFALGQPDAALTTLDERAIERAPRPADALALRARIAWALLDYESAASDLDRALEVLADPDLYLLRARAHAALTRTDAEVDGLREGVLRTSSVVLEDALIESLTRTHRFREALEALEASGVTDVRGALRRASLLGALERRDASREAASVALATIDARARRRPTAARHLERALALALLSRCAEAREALEAADALSPRASALAPIGSTRADVAACREER